MKIGIVVKPKAVLYELTNENQKSKDYTLASDEVLSGWAVGVLERRGEYLKVVTHYGYEGLIKKEELIPSTQHEIRERDEKQECHVVTTGHADLMNVPSVRGRIRDTLYTGSFVFVKENRIENGYCKVYTALGREGYLPQIAITSRKDSDAFLYTDAPEDYFLHQKLCIGEDTFRNEVTEYAKKFLGTQYRWSGKTVDGIDCSGMTFMSYFLCGMLIYRDAKIKEGYPIRKIPADCMKKGDLLYFPGHVAMYLGDNQFIHSTSYEKSFGCVINSLSPSDVNYREDLMQKLSAVGSIF